MLVIEIKNNTKEVIKNVQIKPKKNQKVLKIVSNNNYQTIDSNIVFPEVYIGDIISLMVTVNKETSITNDFITAPKGVTRLHAINWMIISIYYLVVIFILILLLIVYKSLVKREIEINFTRNCMSEFYESLEKIVNDCLKIKRNEIKLFVGDKKEIIQRFVNMNIKYIACKEITDLDDRILVINPDYKYEIVLKMDKNYFFYDRVHISEDPHAFGVYNIRWIGYEELSLLSFYDSENDKIDITEIKIFNFNSTTKEITLRILQVEADIDFSVSRRIKEIKNGKKRKS